MDLEKIKEKHLFQLTVEEFILLQKNPKAYIEREDESVNAKGSKRYVYGIRGIAKLLGCSISSANRIKKKGIIRDAIIQDGRKIIVDAEKALTLIKDHKPE